MRQSYFREYKKYRFYLYDTYDKKGRKVLVMIYINNANTHGLALGKLCNAGAVDT